MCLFCIDVFVYTMVFMVCALCVELCFPIVDEQFAFTKFTCIVIQLYKLMLSRWNDNKKMEFAIVEFTDDKSVAVISTNWLSDNNMCCWPATAKPSAVEKFVKERIEPGASWTEFGVRVMRKYGRFCEHTW